MKVYHKYWLESYLKFFSFFSLQRGIGNAEYIAAFHQIVLPIAYQFNPELIIVSAGFDAAIGDPLGGKKYFPLLIHRSE